MCALCFQAVAQSGSGALAGIAANANALRLVTVPIARLGELLAAEGAREGALTEVRAHMVHRVAQLVELDLADGALQCLAGSLR